MAKGDKKEKKKGIQASSQGIKPAVPTRENLGRDLQDKSQRWESFFKGSDNVYINDLARRKRRSPTHSAVLKSKLVFTKGLGFKYFFNGKEKDLTAGQRAYIDEINDEGESLFDVYTKIQGDYIDFGNAYHEDVKAGKRISIFHRDATTVRIGKNKWKDKAFMSSFWRDIGHDIAFPNGSFPIVDIDITGIESKHLIHIKNYEPEYSKYGIVDHSAALKDADIEYKISTFNFDKLENGFFPSVLIQMFGDAPDDKTPQEYADSLRNNFTGEDNAKKMLIQLLDNGIEGAKIHEFSGAQSGEFEMLKKLSSEAIISAHRWHPALMMLTPGKLANSSDIRTAYELVKNTIVPDYRDPILKSLSKTLNKTNLFTNVELGIIPLVPVSMADKIEPSDVWLVDEQRAETGKEALKDKKIGESLLQKKSSDNPNSDIAAALDDTREEIKGLTDHMSRIETAMRNMDMNCTRNIIKSTKDTDSRIDKLGHKISALQQSIGSNTDE